MGRIQTVAVIQSMNKLDQIKIYKILTGAALLEAKNTIERMRGGFDAPNCVVYVPMGYYMQPGLIEIISAKLNILFVTGTNEIIRTGYFTCIAKDEVFRIEVLKAGEEYWYRRDKSAKILSNPAGIGSALFIMSDCELD